MLSPARSRAALRGITLGSADTAGDRGALWTNADWLLRILLARGLRRRLRHIGHVNAVAHHRVIHLTWKVCPHSSRTAISVASKQIPHTV